MPKSKSVQPQQELSKWITQAAKEMYSRGSRSTSVEFNWHRIIMEALALGVRHGRKMGAQ